MKPTNKLRLNFKVASDHYVKNFIINLEDPSPKPAKKQRLSNAKTNKEPIIE